MHAPAPLRVPKMPSPTVQEWRQCIGNSMKARRISPRAVKEDSLLILAGYFSLIGPPGLPEAQQVYGPLVQLFLAKWRVHYLTKNLAALPADAESIRKVAAAVEAAGKIEQVEYANFPVPRFIEVALKLVDPGEYIVVCQQDAFRDIRSIFHPATYHHASKRYRGVVGDLARRRYIDEIRHKIKTFS